jgi:glycosyltransferase involved in cell wall biosynthesis
MRVLMIAPEPFFAYRGTPFSIQQRLWALSTLGHSVDLLCYHIGADVEIPGVTIHRLPRIPFIKSVEIGFSWVKILLDVLLILRAITMLAVRRYDLIHAHEEAAYFSIPLARLFGARHIYDMHSSLPRQLAGSPLWRSLPFKRLAVMIEHWVIRASDAVISVGADLEEYIHQVSPKGAHRRIENLPIQTECSLDPDLVTELKVKWELASRLSVVYTGNLEQYQGVELLLQSAAIVRNEHPEVLFLIIGGTPAQVERWQAVARQHNVVDSVRFVGAVPPMQALAYLEAAEILVSPRIEGTSIPLKIYSYLHSGKPIIATDVPAHTELLHDDISLLVAPTAKAFADGISRLATDVELRQRIGSQAQAYVKGRFDFPEYRAKIAEIYWLALAAKNRVPDTLEELATGIAAEPPIVWEAHPFRSSALPTQKREQVSMDAPRTR